MTHRNVYMTDELQAIYDQTVEVRRQRGAPQRRPVGGGRQGSA